MIDDLKEIESVVGVDDGVYKMTPLNASKIEIGEANLMAGLNQTETTELQESLEKLGFRQDLPIEVVNGKLLDGRHRIKLSRNLNFQFISVSIKTGLSEIDKLNLVMSHEVGREKNPLQKGFLALKLVNTYGITAVEAFRRTGAKKKTYQRCKQIFELNEMIADELYIGKGYILKSGVVTFSLQVIIEDMKIRINNPFGDATTKLIAEDWEVQDKILELQSEYKSMLQILVNFKLSANSEQKEKLLKLLDSNDLEQLQRLL